MVASDGIRLVTRTADGWREDTLVKSSLNPGTRGVASADLDGDGRADYVLWGSSPSVLFARSDGSYRVQGLTTVQPVNSITPVDVDGDGLIDLVVTAGDTGRPGIVQVLRNTGGSFEPYATAASGSPYAVRGVLVDDVDGDGWPDVVFPSSNSAEVLNNICATPRMRIAAVPAAPVEGSPVTLVVHALSADANFYGTVTIREGSTVLATRQPYLAADLATVSWTSPPLAPGSHTFGVEYDDFYGGSSQTSIVVTTRAPTLRRRPADH